MEPLVLIASLFAGAATLLVSYGAWSLATSEKQRVSLRISRTGIGTRTPQHRTANLLVADRTHPAFTPVDRALARYSWAERSRQQLEKADVNLYVSEFLAIRLVATAVALAVPLLLLPRELLFIVGSCFFALFVWSQFGAFVKRRIDRRQRAIEAHLDDALVNLSGSIRAGFSFPQACQMAISQLPWPLKEEFQTMIEEVNVGASLDDALRNLAQRVESYEMDMTVNAVLVQRQVGGSLSEVLDSIARTIRERRELRGQLMALTAQQRMSAYFVAGVPILMLGILSLTSWQFMRILFVSTIGNVLMVVGLGLDLIGFLVMRRLTRIDY